MLHSCILMPSPKFRVYKYQEDGESVSHLLEMDLVGTGKTQEDADAALFDAMCSQVSFCVQHKLNPFHPAPKEYFDRWEAAQQSEMLSFVMEPETEPLEVATFVPVGERRAYESDWLPHPHSAEWLLADDTVSSSRVPSSFC